MVTRVRRFLQAVAGGPGFGIVPSAASLLKNSSPPPEISHAQLISFVVNNLVTLGRCLLQPAYSRHVQSLRNSTACASTREARISVR